MFLLFGYSGRNRRVLFCLDYKVKVLEFFDCPGPRQGVEDLRELLHKRVKRIASINTRLNIEKIDGNIIRKHEGSKQVGFKQLGPGVETGVHGVHDEKLAQRRLEDNQPEEKTNTDCLVKEQEKEYQTERKIKTDNVFYSCNERSTQQCVKSGVAKHLGVAGIQRQNGLVDETNVTLFAKLLQLKDDMDARSDVYVLSNGCRKCSDDIYGYYWGYTQAKGNILSMEIVRDHSGNTLRVSQSRFYNGKLIQTLLEGHSILLLGGSLSGDCDVEKNGKWSCIYAVGSQEYQMVCTRLDIASADVGMLDKFNRGLQTDVQVCVDFDYVMGRSITIMESRYELRLVAGIATGALVKGGFRYEGGTWTQVTTLLGVAECCHRVLVGNYYLPIISIKEGGWE
nr:zinc finger, CCHC-type [Tanacetum cinerariifolium]